MARLGALVRTIWEGLVEVGPSEDVAVPLDLREALDMHERQLAYPTRIRGDAVVVNEDGSLGNSLSLPHRYLVVRDGPAPHEIYDYETFAVLFPRGVTTAAELNRVQALIDARGDPENARETGFIASGVYIAEPEAVVQ